MQRIMARLALLTALTATLALVAASVAVAVPAPATFTSLTCSTNYFDTLTLAGGDTARAGDPARPAT
jgi:hypothetical protein